MHIKKPLIFLSVLTVTALLSYLTPSQVLKANAQANVSVRIEDFHFIPQNITVVIGINNSVTWTNFGPSEHTSTSDTGVWDGGVIAVGSSFSFTFTAEGTYSYHCAPHPFMRGEIMVLSSGGETSTTTTTITTSTTTTTTTTLAQTTITTTTTTLPQTTTSTAPTTTTLPTSTTSSTTTTTSSTTTTQPPQTTTSTTSGTTTTQPPVTPTPDFTIYYLTGGIVALAVIVGIFFLRRR